MCSLVRMAMHKSNWLQISIICLIVILLICMPLALGSNSSTSISDWTMFRQNPSHIAAATGNSSFNSAELLWNYTTGRMVQSSPAVAEGYVFVGSRDSQVYCLNATDGEPVWKYATGSEVWSSPAIYNERVYVGADNGYVYCLNIAAGMARNLLNAKSGSPQSDPDFFKSFV